jgi:hypothetical protein
LDRQKAGDELAMHLHMHFDLIKAAGIQPKTSHGWGLMTNEGYDIPTTEYTPEEFRTVVSFGKKLARNYGLPEFKGYRAGGWFINAPLLNILEEEGFMYDSSGRDRPTTGAFHTTPWNLPIDAPPYYPDVTDQNKPSKQTRKLMEIPNTGGSTYDLSPEEMITRIESIYKKGILTHPKTIVFVSHPQFASREFSKIPQVLTYLKTIYYHDDKGPVLFVTTSDIHTLWEPLLP